MQPLFSFIRTLCALVMVAALADLLMPSGEMRKYVRLACGMLVLHIMVSQVFVLLGRGAPDIQAQEWTQLVGEMSVLPAQEGTDAARAAYQRQAEQIVLQKARALGMRDPVASIAWDNEGRVSAVILREQEPSVSAGARLGPATEMAAQTDASSLREGMASMLGLPEQSVWIQNTSGH